MFKSLKKKIEQGVSQTGLRNVLGSDNKVRPNLAFSTSVSEGLVSLALLDLGRPSALQHS